MGRLRRTLASIPEGPGLSPERSHVLMTLKLDIGCDIQPVEPPSCISEEMMVSGFTAYYTRPPKMTGTFLEVSSNWGRRWRWNQSNGRVRIRTKLPILNNNEELEVDVELTKYNSRTIKSTSSLLKCSTRHTAWHAEVLSTGLASESIVTFYYCQIGDVVAKDKPCARPIDVASAKRIIECSKVDSVDLDDPLRVLRSVVL